MSGASDGGSSNHPAGAGYYPVGAVEFGYWSSLLKECLVRLGITCEEQLYEALGITMWPNAQLELVLENEALMDGDDGVDPDQGVWAPVDDELADQDQDNPLVNPDGAAPAEENVEVDWNGPVQFHAAFGYATPHAGDMDPCLMM